MTTTLRIENLQQGDYPLGAKVVLKDQVGDVRQEIVLLPNTTLHFNVWQGVELEITEVPIPSRI